MIFIDLLQLLVASSLEDYEQMKDKIDDIELFNKWKYAIDKVAEYDFKTSENTKHAVIIYFVYKIREEK